MKKLVQVLAVLLVMSLSVSFAQQRLYVQGLTNPTDASGAFGAGIAFGSGFVINIGGMVGMTNVAGPLGVRGGILLIASSGGSAFGLGADALFSFGNSRSAADPEFYAGGGLRLLNGGGNTAFGLNGVLGVEIPLITRVSFTAEFLPILLFGGNTQFIGSISAGFRIYP